MTTQQEQKYLDEQHYRALTGIGQEEGEPHGITTEERSMYGIAFSNSPDFAGKHPINVHTSRGDVARAILRMGKALGEALRGKAAAEAELAQMKRDLETVRRVLGTAT